jgi:small subunit ribosomal protein S19e
MAAELQILAQGEFTQVTCVRDVAADKFIPAYAAHLKRSNKLELPNWVDVVKTGPQRELPPMDVDWYYTRAASIARKIYLNPGIGVGALARWYGDKSSSGNRPEHFRKASRGLIRHILQNLEKADLVAAVDAKGGRRLSPEGQKEIDTIARVTV